MITPEEIRTRVDEAMAHRCKWMPLWVLSLEFSARYNDGTLDPATAAWLYASLDAGRLLPERVWAR